MRPRAKAALLTLAGAAVVVALLARARPQELAAAARDAPPGPLALALVCYAAFFILRGLRWRLLLETPDIALRSTTGISAVGWLANSLLPLKGGDVLRAGLLARRERLTLASCAASVALERVLDLIGVATFAALGLPLLPRAATLPDWLAHGLALAWIIPLVGLSTLALLVIKRARVALLLERMTPRAGRIGRGLSKFLIDTLDATAALARRPRRLLILAPLTLAVAGFQALVITNLAIAFLGLAPTIAFAGSCLFLLSFVVSLTPGNVGTYEAAFVAVFVALGASADRALDAAILTHLSTTLIVALLGGLGFAALGVSAREPAAPTRPTTPHTPTRGGGNP